MARCNAPREEVGRFPERLIARDSELAADLNNVDVKAPERK